MRKRFGVVFRVEILWAMKIITVFIDGENWLTPQPIDFCEENYQKLVRNECKEAMKYGIVQTCGF
jgi:hypothetical protein